VVLVRVSPRAALLPWSNRSTESISAALDRSRPRLQRSADAGDCGPVLDRGRRHRPRSTRSGGSGALNAPSSRVREAYRLRTRTTIQGLRRVSDDGPVCVIQRREPLYPAASIQSSHVGGRAAHPRCIRRVQLADRARDLHPGGQGTHDPALGPARRVPATRGGRATEPNAHPSMERGSEPTEDRSTSNATRRGSKSSPRAAPTGSAGPNSPPNPSMRSAHG
jgi:hypothetical protein